MSKAKKQKIAQSITAQVMAAAIEAADHHNVRLNTEQVNDIRAYAANLVEDCIIDPHTPR